MDNSLLTISAAAVGVGALKSAIKSAIVKSVSCPTAEIVAIFDEAIALTTLSSLKDHRSSIEPPPRAIINTSDFVSYICRLNGTDNVLYGCRALNLCGVDDDIDVFISPINCTNNILDHSTTF